MPRACWSSQSRSGRSQSRSSSFTLQFRWRGALGGEVVRELTNRVRDQQLSSLKGWGVVKGVLSCFDLDVDSAEPTPVSRWSARSAASTNDLDDGAERFSASSVRRAEKPLLDLLAEDLQAAVADPDSDSWAELNTLLRAEVSQATGMLLAQLEVEPAEAMVRVRAHAFATGRSATAVACDILDRRLRLQAD